jgi:hypothetical protein
MNSLLLFRDQMRCAAPRELETGANAGPEVIFTCM